MYKMFSNILLSRLTPYAEEITGDNTMVDFDDPSQLLIIHSAFVKYLIKNGNTMKWCVSSLYTSRKLMIQLGSTAQGLPCNVDIYPAGREISTFYVTRKFITVFTKVRHPESILSCPNLPLRYILILFHLFLRIPTSQAKITYKFTIYHMLKIPPPVSYFFIYPH